MPAAQGEVTNHEVRFTLRFRRTITIAAASVSSSFVIGPAQHAAQCRGPADDRGIVRLLRPIREYHGAPEPKFASDDAPAATGGSETAEACERSIWIAGDFSAGRLRRRLRSAPAKAGIPGGGAFREQGRSGEEYALRERGRRRTRQDQISCRALGPVKLRIVKDTRTERRKTCFFCRTGFERAGFF